VKACRKFEKVNIATGPLKTSMILLNQKGHLKLINILSAPEDSLKDSTGIGSYYGKSWVMQHLRSYAVMANRSTTMETSL
jgi:hypothetical protein